VTGFNLLTLDLLVYCIRTTEYMSELVLATSVSGAVPGNFCGNYIGKLCFEAFICAVLGWRETERRYICLLL
jgi:hypothetical protein